ncbi:hypothetical protein OIU74_018457 [Salix koriyanagi]|uniref:Uncharacterized protein n=1 Tax=Salix koriyanagi TaxID=2511006 RepID=A0A9Q0WRT5_9ROSI|nr:hypothetical protein OIU74_018457 [Salix koriyanagi]
MKGTWEEPSLHLKRMFSLFLQVTYIASGGGRVHVGSRRVLETTDKADGRTSVWKALSPQVLEASFKVSPDVEQLFRAKRMDEEIFFPRPKMMMHSFILYLSVMAIRVCRVLYESYPSLH